MNVNDMYRICQFAVNKAQNGYLTPSDFNLVINQAQTSYQDYLLGEFQQYQYGRPQARINYSQNENIRQRLTPLITEKTLTIGGSGEVLYPSDYVQTDSMITSDFKRIRYVSQDRLYSYYNSEIDPIETNPVYLIEPTGFQFYPVDLGSAILTYVKNAPAIVWGYCLDSNNRPIYNPAPPPTTTTTTIGPATTTTTSSPTTTTTSAPTTTTAAPTTTTTTLGTNCTYSVQPVWDDVDLLEIITRALKLIGLNLQDGMVAQYANQITQTGQ
jgi:hypothetical protein